MHQIIFHTQLASRMYFSYNLGPVHTLPEKCGNSILALKTHQMFSRSHHAGEIKNATIIGHF